MLDGQHEFIIKMEASLESLQIFLSINAKLQITTKVSSQTLEGFSYSMKFSKLEGKVRDALVSCSWEQVHHSLLGSQSDKNYPNEAQLSVLGHVYNLSTWEAEAGGS